MYRSHEILRSSCVSNEAGVFLRSDATTPLNISEYDLGHLSRSGIGAGQKLISEQTGLAFALDRAPLIRVSLMTLATDHHILTITLHHIIIDEWSMEVLIKQLAERYNALLNGEKLPRFSVQMQFKDYAYWESRRTFVPGN